TLVTLEVVEKTLRPGGTVIADEPCDLTAARDAVIDDIIVLAGRARVRKGDTVHAGDVLVEGIMGADLVADYPHVVPVPVRARGLIHGRVWREGEADVPLTQVEYRRTGESCQRWVMKVGKWETILWGRRIPYSDYMSPPEPERRGLWRNLRLPVELTRTTYYEVERLETQLTPAEARARAERLATNLALRDVPDGAVIVGRETFVRVEDSTHVVVRVVVETREEIAGPLVPRQ
ncbi:MAG: sporulation protein YqfD, partial [Chloroflexota bacterium]